eukprot:3773082-Pleurochrysis_carterae.AAC.11
MLAVCRKGEGAFSGHVSSGEAGAVLNDAGDGKGSQLKRAQALGGRAYEFNMEKRRVRSVRAVAIARLCACARACARVRACVRAFVLACVRACVRARVCVRVQVRLFVGAYARVKHTRDGAERRRARASKGGAREVGVAQIGVGERCVAEVAVGSRGRLERRLESVPSNLANVKLRREKSARTRNGHRRKSA